MLYRCLECDNEEVRGRLPAATCGTLFLVVRDNWCAGPAAFNRIDGPVLSSTRMD